MKVSLYMDVSDGFKPEIAMAVGVPSSRPPNSTRYRLDFEIADPNRPDEIVKPAVTISPQSDEKPQA